jgi:hypothetical protein
VELIRLFGSDAATAEAATDSRAPRLEAAEAGFNREVKLSPGGPAELLNVSETGILVEGKTRLSTGSKVVITLTGREQKRLSGRVVRCQVCAIHRDGTMTYQTALALDQPAGLETAAAAPEPAVEKVENNVNGSSARPAAPPLAAAARPVPPVVASTAARLVNQW